MQLPHWRPNRELLFPVVHVRLSAVYGCLALSRRQNHQGDVQVISGGGDFVLLPNGVMYLCLGTTAPRRYRLQDSSGNWTYIYR